MKRENLLIICFDIKDFKKIKKIDMELYDKVFVASDDYRVHKKCNDLNSIKGVTFLQKPIPYTKVANNVIECIEKINSYYEEVSLETKIFKKEIIEWPYHVEGGNTSQVIQDTLLYIESLYSITSQYNIKEILLISNSQYILYGKVIKEFSKANTLKFLTIKKVSLFISRKQLKSIMRPIYYLIKTIYIKVIFSFEQIKDEKDVALLWLFNDSIKHINNAFFINDILKKAGLNAILYTWRVGFLNDNRIKNKNINIQRIEKYLSWINIFSSIYKTITIILNRNKLITIFKSYQFYYRNVNLKNIIEPTVINHLLIEAPDSYRFYKGFSNFNSYINIEIMSADLSDQKIGKIVESILPMEEIKKFALSTFLTGKNFYVENRRGKYSKKYLERFYFFVQSNIEKRNILEEMKMDEKNVIVYGSLRGSKKIAVNKKDALKRLGIEKPYKHFILFDYSNLLNGYQSIEENILSLLCVLKTIKILNDVCLIIKPHPSADISILNIIKNNYKYTNVYYMDKNDSPDYGLIVADILITKYSTLGIEAIRYGVMLISVQLDGTDIFKLYENAANYVYSTAELELLIKNMYEKENRYNKYMTDSINRSEFFLKLNYPELDEVLILKHIKILRNM